MCSQAMTSTLVICMTINIENGVDILRIFIGRLRHWIVALMNPKSEDKDVAQ